MKPPDVVRRDFCREWLRSSDDDLSAAARLLEADEPLLAIVAFHCQQGVEKALKAYLTWRQVEFPKTHDLRLLVDLVRSQDEELASAIAGVAVLTPYGVEYRYPGDHPEVEREEAAEALRVAIESRDRVRARLGEDDPGED